MFSDLPNVNMRIIPSLLYKTIRANMPLSGNFSELAESGIISNSNLLFLAQAGYVDHESAGVLGEYNRNMMCDNGSVETHYSKIALPNANQYAHAMCPYVSTSDLADKDNLDYVLIATDWVKLFCLVQPFAVYQGMVYGYKKDPIPVVDAIKESFCKIFEVVPMNAGIKSKLFRNFAQRYCA